VDLDQPSQENPRVNLEDGRRVHLEYASQSGPYLCPVEKKPPEKRGRSPSSESEVLAPRSPPRKQIVYKPEEERVQTKRQPQEEGRTQTTTRERELETKVRELEAQVATQAKRLATPTNREEEKSSVVDPGESHRVALGTIDVGPFLIQALQSMTEVLREQRSMNQNMMTMFTTFMERMAPPAGHYHQVSTMGY